MQIAADPKRLKQAASLLALGIAGIVALVALRACAPSVATPGDQPFTTISETGVEQITATDAAVRYATAALDISYLTSAPQYEARLAALSRNVDTTFPLTGLRFAECMQQQCQWRLRDAAGSVQNDVVAEPGETVVDITGVLEVMQSDGDVTSDFRARVLVDDAGVITAFTPQAGGELVR